MSIYYTYKILFSSGHYYIGRRKCPHNTAPETDSYLGSPVTNSHYWEQETPEKSILEIFEDCDEHLYSEEKHLGDKWKTDPLCLNNSPANGISNSGMIWCNDGIREYMLPEIPEGYVAGRLGSTAKGKRYFTSGNESRMFFVGEEPEGWALGNHNSKGSNNASVKYGSSIKGKTCYTNNNKTIYIGKGEKIPEGFVLGRSDSFCEKRSSATKGKNNPRYGSRGEKWYNNGTVNKLCVPGNEPEGYKRGMLKRGKRR